MSQQEHIEVPSFQHYFISLVIVALLAALASALNDTSRTILAVVTVPDIFLSVRPVLAPARCSKLICEPELLETMNMCKDSVGCETL